MAQWNSFDELCKAAEPVFDENKYEAYCRSIPKMLAKASELKGIGQDKHAFMLLWRAAFLAAQLQKVPKVSERDLAHVAELSSLTDLPSGEDGSQRDHEDRS